MSNKMPSETSANILIVEDTPEIAELLRLHLSMNGYETQQAITGHEALELARQGDADLIIAIDLCDSDEY